MKVSASQLVIDRLIYYIVEYAKKHASESGRGGFHELLKKCGYDVGQTTTNRWLNCIEVRHKLPAWALPCLVLHYQRILENIPGAPSALTPLTHIAQQAGYSLTPLNPPKIDGPCHDFFMAVARNQKESADVISAAAEAISDGNLTNKELIRISIELYEQMEAVSLLIDMVNGKLGEVEATWESRG